MTNLRSLAIFAILIPCVLTSYAQVIFKNSGTNKIFVAYATMVNGNWTSRGWFPVVPGEEKSVYSYTAFNNPNFYYCAKIENSDQGYYGSTSLYVHRTNAFTIPNADKPRTFSDTEMVPMKFIQLDLRGKSSHTIELAPQNLTLRGLPQGKWRIPLDKEGDEALKPDDAEGYREITFENGRPLGWCKDYDQDGRIRAIYKLSSFRPLIYEGKCTWYKPDGTIEKELIYQNGQAVSSSGVNANGTLVNKQATYKVVTLPVRDFVVNSTAREIFAGGRSRVTYTPPLPAGTVKWFYEFSANRTDVDKDRVRANFQMAATLSRLIDESGLLAASVNALGKPPGSNYCDVYLMDSRSGNAFINGKTFNYWAKFSQLNLRSGIMEVGEMNMAQPTIGIANNDPAYGINITIQVVAIVAEL